MPSKAATTTAPARGSRKVGRLIRGVMVRDIFAVAERSDIDALATRLDPAGRPAIAGLAITPGRHGRPAASSSSCRRPTNSTSAMFPTISHTDRAACLRRANLIAISAEVVRNARAFRMLYARSNRIRRHHTHEQSDARFDRAVCGFPDPCRMRGRAGSSPFPADRAGPLIALAMAFRVGRAH